VPVGDAEIAELTVSVRETGAAVADGVVALALSLTETANVEVAPVTDRPLHTNAVLPAMQLIPAGGAPDERLKL
jgi:hypothetical protein